MKNYFNFIKNIKLKEKTNLGILVESKNKIKR